MRNFMYIDVFWLLESYLCIQYVEKGQNDQQKWKISLFQALDVIGNSFYGIIEILFPVVFMVFLAGFLLFHIILYW
jgi:hypothetical protein